MTWFDGPGTRTARQPGRKRTPHSTQHGLGPRTAPSVDSVHLRASPEARQQTATKQGPSPHHSGCPHGVLLLPGVGGSSVDKPLGSLSARPYGKPHVGCLLVSGDRQGRFLQ